ncbi:MAG: cyanophycin synthetase [Brevundimonas sp.]
MRVLETGVYRGPHLYGRWPMVRIQLDLGDLEQWPSDQIPGFNAALLAELPGLHRHGCCYGEPGGFVRRLEDGTWLGHVVEHVALELQRVAGSELTRGKTRSVKGRPGVYNVMFAYVDEQTGRMAGRLALQIVDRLLPDSLKGLDGLGLIISDDRVPGLADVFSADAAAPLIAALARKGAFGPSTQALVDAARRRGIPVSRLNDQSLVQLGWGSRQRRLRATVTDRTSLVAAELAGDKAQAKTLLAAIGCPVAKGDVVTSADEALDAARRLKAPVVLKPLDGNHGRGVTTGLRTETDILQAFVLASQHGRRVIVEEELPGRDHRILVVDGRVVAVAERKPAQVVGDGRSSVSDLVAAVNDDPRRGLGHEKALTRIRLDDEAAAAILLRQGLTVDSVPARGRVVTLRTTANLSSGGTAIDRTDDIHPDNAAIARRAALAIGLDVAGIDLLAPDITRSIRETGGGIVEVNAAPGLRMHLEPSEGMPRDVAEPIIRMMYPRGSRARIPILAVTGTNGKSTVGRMLAHVFAAQGQTVGLTNTSGVYIGDERVHAGDASGPRSARLVLRDPTVDVAVLECARGGILREGLAFDRCDVGAVLNVQRDHLGLQGVNTLEDLAAVKSVVTESVSRRGVSVLNADDPLTLRMAAHAGGRICWFSMRGGDESPGFLLKHLGDGGMGCVHDAVTGAIVLYDRGATMPVCQARDIPATLDGRAAFNIQNALAAAAMSYAAGVEPAAIGTALTTFRSTYEQNPGRLNVHDDHGFRVIMDYAHNPEGLRALGRMVTAIKPETARSIAMLSVPGDRRNEEILAMGEIGAEFFDHLVFRETPDNRGRPTGEVIRMMTQGALQTGFDGARIQGVHREEDAVQRCLDMARPGDLVVLTPTRIDAVWRQVLGYRQPPTFQSTDAPDGVILEPPHG